MEMQTVYVHTDAEIKKFIAGNKLLIYKACKDAKIRHCDWDDVVNNVAIKYAEGKIDFDLTRGVKYSTYIYSIAFNSAIDALRKLHPERFQDLDDKGWKNIKDEHENNAYADDVKIIVSEALRRLAKEMRDKVKLELLVRYVFNEEKREDLSAEYKVENDYVSLIKTRYISRLQKHVRDVMQEDENGKLKLGDSSEVKFLKPYLKW